MISQLTQNELIHIPDFINKTDHKFIKFLPKKSCNPIYKYIKCITCDLVIGFLNDMNQTDCIWIMGPEDLTDNSNSIFDVMTTYSIRPYKMLTCKEYIIKQIIE